MYVGLTDAISTNTCSICLEDILDEDTNKIITKCKHVFHEKCIKSWFILQNFCPNCRRNDPLLDKDKTEINNIRERFDYYHQDRRKERIELIGTIIGGIAGIIFAINVTNTANPNNTGAYVISSLFCGFAGAGLGWTVSYLAAKITNCLCLNSR